MWGVGAAALRPLTSVSTYRRWVHLLLGAALLLPYAAVAGSLYGAVSEGTGVSVGGVLVLLAAAVTSVAVAFLPAVHVLAVTAARALLGVGLADSVTGSSVDWHTRRRAAGWYAVNLVLGGLVGTLSVTVLPVAAFLLAAPFDAAPLDVAGWQPATEGAAGTAAAVLLAVALPVALVYVVAGCGALLARLAPMLLGPSPAERIAALERAAEQMFERTRLARELHDSVGHALTVTTVQAAAASRVLDTDPDFSRRALEAIQQAARTALADLDHVLGLLRDEMTGRDSPDSTDSPDSRDSPDSPQPKLTDLHRLLDETRTAGVAVDAAVPDDLSGVPAAVSREAYRIVQEGLTNALRHAGRVPVQLRCTVRADAVELEMTNPLPDTNGHAPAQRSSRGGGRGLPGMRERVAVLHGQVEAAPVGDTWRVLVTLPTGPTS